MNKYQEALDSIKYTVVDIAADGYHEPKTVEDFNYEQCLLMQELVDKTISAKPVDVQDPTFGDFKLSCPRCKRTLYNVPKYCPNCGQALRWEEEE